MQRHVHGSTHAYVPFERVQAILRDTPERVFADPAGYPGEGVHTSEIEVHAGGFPIHDRFTVEFGEFEIYPEHHFCRLHLTYQGDRHHVVVPEVHAVVDASDAGDDRTQLELVGHYSPRLGALGALEDMLVGHRAVEEAMTVVLTSLAAALERLHRVTDVPVRPAEQELRAS